jgi:hypothetical protein
MAKANDSILTRGWRGAIGKEVVYRTFKTGTFSGKYPDMSKVIPSKNQTKRRSIFADAVAFAKTAMKDPKRIAKFKSSKSQSPYHAAIKEYMSLFGQTRSGKLELPVDLKRSLQKLQLTEPQQKAALFVYRYKKLNNRIYQKLNDASKATATRHLLELVKLDIIQSNNGKGAGAYYGLGSWWKGK